jgi:hypothetical protein
MPRISSTPFIGALATRAYRQRHARDILLGTRFELDLRQLPPANCSTSGSAR